MNTNPFCNALAVVLLSAVAASASAADTTTFNVNLTVTSSCTITAAAATDVDFGSAASTTATPLLAQGSVTANCSLLLPYSIALDAGSNPGTAGDISTRRMKNTLSNNYVGYQLYRDAALLLPWGYTTGGGANVQTGAGLGVDQTYLVYGQVANLSSNNAPVGDYLDVVTATITY